MSKTVLIGLSGPSSSGKTTLARLLRQVFNTDTPTTTTTITSTNSKRLKLRLFIIHLDDFYFTDTQILRKQFASPEFGSRDLEDWDCVEALDLQLLKRVLGHVKGRGRLPDDFASKEDENTVGESGVSMEEVEGLREGVARWVDDLSSTGTSKAVEGEEEEVTICLLDGFLLYPDPKSEAGSQLRQLHDILAPLLDLKIWIPSTRQQTIDRRTKRTGYVTLEGFWEDPPGYVEDVVWPNYAKDHAWLFGQAGGGAKDDADGKVGEAIDAGRMNRKVANEASIQPGPGCGEVHLKEILPWSVEKLKQAIGSELC